jgi:hypothetical protein
MIYGFSFIRESAIVTESDLPTDLVGPTDAVAELATIPLCQGSCRLDYSVN